MLNIKLVSHITELTKLQENNDNCHLIMFSEETVLIIVDVT